MNFINDFTEATNIVKLVLIYGSRVNYYISFNYARISNEMWLQVKPRDYPIGSNRFLTLLTKNIREEALWI